MKKTFPVNEKQMIDTNHVYEFWKNEPTIKNKTNMVSSKIINSNLQASTAEIFNSNISSHELDLEDNTKLTPVLEFLNKFYSESKTKLIFTKEYLKFNLLNESKLFYFTNTTQNTIIGTIAYTINNMRIKTQNVNLAEIKLLCLSNDYRHNNYAEKLILFIKNKLLSMGVKVGLFTTNRYIPTPITKIDYYCRPINYQKVLDSKYTVDGINNHKNDKTDKDAKEEYKKNLEYNLLVYKITRKLPKNIIKFDETMLSTYGKNLFDIYLTYMEQYDFYTKYTYNEFINLLLNPIVSVYLILDENKIPIDFFSFYKTTHSSNINVSHLLLYSIISSTFSVVKLLEWFAVTSNDEKLDVFEVPNTFENAEILTDPDSLFKPRNTEDMQYINLYNWECPVLKSNQIGRTF